MQNRMSRRAKYFAALTLCLGALPGQSIAQSMPIDIFHQVAYGRRSVDVTYDAPLPKPGQSEQAALDLISRIWNIGQWKSAEHSDGFIGVENDFVPMTAYDPTAQKLRDYFCIGSEITVGVPTGWSFKSATIRFWTDFGSTDLQAWKFVPLTEAGSWSKADTEGWTIGGSVGFFGNTPTGSVSGDYSFSTSKQIALPGITVTNHSRALSGNDPAWEFSNVAGDGTPAGSRNAPTLQFFDQFLLRADSGAIRVPPQFFGPLDYGNPPSKAKPAFTPDHLPGLLIHFQVTLHLVGPNGGNRVRYAIWKGPVSDFVAPFAPLPYLSPPPRGHIGVVNDGGSAYYKVAKTGQLTAIVESKESDPAKWVEKGAALDPNLSKQFAVQKWNTYCDPAKRDTDPKQDPTSKKAVCLSVGADWITPGRIADLGDTDTVQATLRQAQQTMMYPVMVRSVRLTRDPNVRPNSEDADYHIIPTSVLFDLLLKGFDKQNLSEATQDWLQETGWTYLVWMNDEASSKNGTWHPPA
jgi:hypothetical protein